MVGGGFVEGDICLGVVVGEGVVYGGRMMIFVVEGG